MRLPLTAVVLLLGSTQIAACTAPTGASPMPEAATQTERPAGQHRFIVKFRDGSAPAQSPEAARAKLASTAVPGVQLEWQRRLGVQADLFFTSRPLDAAEAEALMQRFRADPDVEYIEPDGRMGIDPIRGPELQRGS